MKAQRRAANGFLPAAVLACALFADLGHAGQWSRPGLRASLSGSSGGACSAGLPDGRSFITGGCDRAGPLASTAYFETDGRTTPAAPMLGPRADHVCVALDDGTAYGPKTRIGGPKGAEPGALISLDPDQALQALRPMPRYGSHLGSIMHEHIQRMRTLGCRYGHENVFLRFDRFLQQRPDADHESVDTLIHEYVADARSVNARLRRLILGRIIARALNRQGTSVAVPPIDPLLLRQNRNQQLQPYIYTEEEVERLLATASGFPSPRAPLRPLTLYTMLTLAYCAGLRLGEIVRLKLRDVDLPDGSIEICDTKFFKSRRLPLSTTAITDLSDYLKTRRRAGAPLDPESSVFWHNRGWFSRGSACGADPELGEPAGKCMLK